MEARRAGIRSDQLKIFAMIFMLADHIGAAWIEMVFMRNTQGLALNFFIQLDGFFRAAGRLAFPIFAYQLVVGFKMTRNKMKAFRSILIFAIASEIPFQLCFYNKLIDFKHQSVMLTLALGFAMMHMFELVGEHRLKAYLQGMILVIFSVAAYMLHTDYDASGIILIAAIYFFYADRREVCIVSPIIFLMAAFVIYIIKGGQVDKAIQYVSIESYSLISFILIYYDNGIRKGGKILKWIGYLFYPLHMLLLYLVRIVVL